MDWYSLCKKYKILDWIDDNIIWYVWDKPKSIYKSIRYWFYCNWNKEHWELMKAAFTSYPWDYYYGERLLQCQINKQIKWFEKHHLVENCDENTNRPLRWAQHCIKYAADDTDLCEYSFETKKRTYIGPRINFRNIDRFIKLFKIEFKEKVDNDYLIEYYKKYPEEYYKLKCRYILFKILWNYEHNWWD